MPFAVQRQPYQWRLSGSFAAHLFKATARQHHRDLYPLFTRFIPPTGVVFDIGAHAGQYTKLFTRAAPRGRVYAFEPGSYERMLLRAALAIRRHAKVTVVRLVRRAAVAIRRLANVSVVPLALGAAAGIEVLNVPLKPGGSLGFGLSHLGGPQSRWTAVAQELVAVTTLDAASEALRLDRLDFVKADIEGWEVALLRGGEATLRRFRPVLVLEMLSQHLARAGDSVEDAFARLTRLGYVAFALTRDNRFVRLAAPRDGEFWFISGGEFPPLID